MLHWFGHAPVCHRFQRIPSYRGDHALVCAACMPDFVPHCSLCKRPAQALEVSEGFTHYDFWYLCPTCVANVRRGGPPEIRRARSNQARVEALQERYPGVYVAETARRRIQLAGDIAGRAVLVTLKFSAREHDDERYVLRVELRSHREAVTRADLGIDDALLVHMAERSPTITVDRHRWLRLGFRHLGKLDLLNVLDAMLASAERLDDAA